METKYFQQYPKLNWNSSISKRLNLAKRLSRNTALPNLRKIKGTSSILGLKDKSELSGKLLEVSKQVENLAPYFYKTVQKNPGRTSELWNDLQLKNKDWLLQNPIDSAGFLERWTKSRLYNGDFNY